MKEVLNGGYNVHPVPPPNSDIKESIRKRYERERIKIQEICNEKGLLRFRIQELPTLG